MADPAELAKQAANAIAEGAKPQDVANWIKQYQAQPQYAKDNSFEDMYNNRQAALAGTFGQNGVTGEDGMMHDINVDPTAAAQAYKLKYGIDPTQSIDPNAWVGRAYGSNLLGLKSGSAAHTSSQANGFNDNGNANSWTNNSAEDAITMGQLKRFDPNATIDANGNYKFDQSKLPQFMGGHVNPDASKYGGWVKAPIHTGDKGHVLDKNAVYKDPIYGDVTYRQNTFDPSSDGNGGFMGQMEKYMPSIITAIMSAGMGAGAGPLVGSLLSSTLGPGGIGNKLAMHEKINWGNVAKNTGMSLAGSALGSLGSAGGNLGQIGQTIQSTMPWLNRAQQAYSLYQMYNHGRG